MEPATDFDVSVDAQQTSGGAKTHYGFIVRHTAPDSWYEFAVTGYGSFTISSTLTDEYKVLNFGTPSSAIKIGEVNHLRLIGAGSQFTFYINDEVIAIVNDETLAEGTVGVMVEAYDKENPGATFEFSNFVLRELPTQAAAPGTPPAPPAATPAATPGAAD